MFLIIVGQQFYSNYLGAPFVQRCHLASEFALSYKVPVIFSVYGYGSASSLYFENARFQLLL